MSRLGSAETIQQRQLASGWQPVSSTIVRGQPEIRGYTREYLDASSPRSQQIQAYLDQQGVKGAGAAQIAAHQTRDDKLPAITHAEMQQKHRDVAARFGQQPEQVIRAAHERRVEQEPQQKHQHLESALTYAQE